MGVIFVQNACLVLELILSKGSRYFPFDKTMQTHSRFLMWTDCKEMNVRPETSPSDILFLNKCIYVKDMIYLIGLTRLNLTQIGSI